MPLRKRKVPNSTFIRRYGKIAFHYAELEQLMRTTMKDVWGVSLNEAMARLHSTNEPLCKVSGKKLQVWFYNVVSPAADVSLIVSDFDAIREYRNDLIHGVLHESSSGAIEISQRETYSKTTLNEMSNAIRKIKNLYAHTLSVKNAIRARAGQPLVISAETSVT